MSEDSGTRGRGPWTGRPHGQLAGLARELLLAGHLIDRSGMPQLISRFGREAMTEVAIDEWMAASPLYTRRMQRLLGFEGDTVEVIFKGMQLDIGAPPEFMDFRFTVHDDTHGEFRLDHCGALMDVEPLGEGYVVSMCHDIEDPTFDATAAATNPRAAVRPIHRPPRTPVDRHPHCAWTVVIDPDADPLPPAVGAAELEASTAAMLALGQPDPSLAVDDGWSDYSAPLDADLAMEDFSSATLSAILDEVCLQGHLLSRAFLLCVAARAGAGEAAEIGARQAAGIAGLTTKRLAILFGVGPDLDGVAAVLEAHPLFLPRPYVDLRLDRTTKNGIDSLTLSLGPCPALNEEDGLTWPAILASDSAGADAAIAAAVICLAPRARVRRLVPVGGAVATWNITVDPDAPPARQPDEVTLTEFSTGADFVFARH